MEKVYPRKDWQQGLVGPIFSQPKWQNPKKISFCFIFLFCLPGGYLSKISDPISLITHGLPNLLPRNRTLAKQSFFPLIYVEKNLKDCDISKTSFSRAIFFTKANLIMELMWHPYNTL